MQFRNSLPVKYRKHLGRCERVLHFMGREVQGRWNSERELSDGWSRSYRDAKLLLPAERWAVAKLQGDKSAPRSQGRKKPWQPQTWQDLTRFSPLDFRYFLQILGGARLTKLHRSTGEKAKKSSGEPPVETAPPEIADFCPLSWSNLSWQSSMEIYDLAWPSLQSLAAKKSFIFWKFWAVKNF